MAGWDDTFSPIVQYAVVTLLSFIIRWTKTVFCKRVIGLPGEHIKLLDKTVLVNGERLPEDYARHVLHDYNPYRDSFPDITFMVASLPHHGRGSALAQAIVPLS